MEHMHNVMINTIDYVGPHCGGEREEEKLKNSIVELVPDLVPTLEMVTQGQQQMMAEQYNVSCDGSMGVTVIKEIGKLEQRIEELEKEVQQLKGGMINE
ncbi:MAG: hypothetical protein BZ138_07960 [Methanosphaera sp. rholeuAM270]|nr:MAG: hypothetical protein BZ138_07960 [Methanosphaera sp. rholeuAM270]